MSITYENGMFQSSWILPTLFYFVSTYKVSIFNSMCVKHLIENKIRNCNCRKRLTFCFNSALVSLNSKSNYRTLFEWFYRKRHAYCIYKKKENPYETRIAPVPVFNYRNEYVGKSDANISAHEKFNGRIYYTVCAFFL